MSSKGGKRISVFDRLGPGTDEFPPQPSPTHRRYSTDKHGEKGRAPHVRGEEALRERKPSSHSDYPYRGSGGVAGGAEPGISQPPSLPPSRPRHRHFRGSESEHSEEEGGGRGEKKTRKLRDTPEGAPKEVYHKLHPPSEDRGLGASVGRSGGGRVKRGAVGARASSESVSVSDGESGGEEGRRKRSYRADPERRSKHALEGVPLEEGRRSSKHLERREKFPTERGHGHHERTLSSGIGGGGVEPKPPRFKPELKEERERERERVDREREREAPPHHKRRREETHPEFRHLERKRKHEALEDLPLPDTKRPRMTMEHPPLKEMERPRPKMADERYPARGGGKEADPGERKRRYEGRESILPPPPRKRATSQSPEGTGRRANKQFSPMGRLGEQRKRERETKEKDGKERETREREAKEREARERETKEKERKPEPMEVSKEVVSDTESTGAGGNAPAKKLDWSTLSELSVARPKPVRTPAVDTFSPGALFAKIGVSPTLAGKQLFRKVSGLVGEHLRDTQRSLNPQTDNVLPESLLKDPFVGAEFASAGASWIQEQREWTKVFSDIGPCRRALTASADFAIRRKLRKANREFLPTSQPSTTWDSEHYATAVALYQSQGKKASGKPAFRVEHSRVGTLLIAR